MDKTLLKNIAETETWEHLKIILNEYIDEVKDVTKPLNVSGFKISVKEAYLAKALTVVKLQEFINYIDINKSNKSTKVDKKDLFI